MIPGWIVEVRSTQQSVDIIVGSFCPQHYKKTIISKAGPGGNFIPVGACFAVGGRGSSDDRSTDGILIRKTLSYPFDTRGEGNSAGSGSLPVPLLPQR